MNTINKKGMIINISLIEWMNKYLLNESKNKHISFPRIDTAKTFDCRTTLVLMIGLFFAAFRIVAKAFIERPKLTIKESAR